ncbi:hypothetical protein HPG69_009127 [Diceros bicornis minor]|uniref:Uncharacterized protein n=1 Tax=Diceros bicornis minor TaxID=77932 RepID=A0A7J7F0I1_DICBM|nr:hypothetical protein HPG69_009127 [Diceros bicornis minor]
MQFNSVANCVVTTCLGNLSMMAPVRNRLVEPGSRESSEKFKELYSEDNALSRELMTKIEWRLEVWERRREYKIMREILLLQEAADNYKLEPKE